MASIDTFSPTGQVYRQVLRYIRVHGLTAGDYLPAQPRWLADLGCGTRTLNRAMKLLQSHGVIARQPKTGTQVIRTAPDRPIAWSVGVCMPKLETLSSVYSRMLQFLLVRLQESNCQLQLYPLRCESNAQHRFHAISEFGGLDADLKMNRLDGVLSITRLRTEDYQHLTDQGVVTCRIMTQDPHESGVVIDLGAMIRESVSLLWKQGCRKIALVGGADGPWERVYEGVLWEAFLQSLASVGGNEPLGFHAARFVPGGRAMAEQLLQLPPEKRPDGLVCVWDDYFVLGLTQVLRHHGLYHPHIAALTSQQAMVPFFLPAYRFEVDIDEIAMKTRDLLLQRLQAPQIAPPRAWVVPRLHEPAAEVPRWVETYIG